MSGRRVALIKSHGSSVTSVVYAFCWHLIRVSVGCEGAHRAHNTEASPVLRIVDGGMHPGLASRFLHILEPGSLLGKLLPQLCQAL